MKVTEINERLKEEIQKLKEIAFLEEVKHLDLENKLKR